MVERILNKKDHIPLAFIQIILTNSYTEVLCKLNLYLCDLSQPLNILSVWSMEIPNH